MSDINNILPPDDDEEGEATPQASYSPHHVHGLMRIEYDADPERCGGTNKFGQCHFKRVPGSAMCSIHGGATVAKENNQQALRNYHLTRFQALVGRHSNSVNIKSLRDEVAILRSMIETKINRCNDETDLLLQSNVISDLIAQVTKTVDSMHRLDEKLGVLMDEEQASLLADKLLAIISKYVPESDDKAALADELDIIFTEMFK